MSSVSAAEELSAYYANSMSLSEGQQTNTSLSDAMNGFGFVRNGQATSWQQADVWRNAAKTKNQPDQVVYSHTLEFNEIVVDPDIIYSGDLMKASKYKSSHGHSHSHKGSKYTYVAKVVLINRTRLIDDYSLFDVWLGQGITSCTIQGLDEESVTKAVEAVVKMLREPVLEAKIPSQYSVVLSVLRSCKRTFSMGTGCWIHLTWKTNTVGCYGLHGEEAGAYILDLINKIDSGAKGVLPDGRITVTKYYELRHKLTLQRCLEELRNVSGAIQNEDLVSDMLPVQFFGEAEEIKTAIAKIDEASQNIRDERFRGKGRGMGYLHRNVNTVPIKFVQTAGSTEELLFGYKDNANVNVNTQMGGTEPTFQYPDLFNFLTTSLPVEGTRAADTADTPKVQVPKEKETQENDWTKSLSSILSLALLIKSGPAPVSWMLNFLKMMRAEGVALDVFIAVLEGSNVVTQETSTMTTAPNPTMATTSAQSSIGTPQSTSTSATA